jgi:hypothetical protein
MKKEIDSRIDDLVERLKRSVRAFECGLDSDKIVLTFEAYRADGEMLGRCKIKEQGGKQ